MQTKLYVLPKLHVTQTQRTVGFSCLLFFLPLLLSGPQLLIGSIVNLLLIWAVQKLSRSKAWPLAFLPSIAAVMHGVIFWPFTMFLVYMMPAIWLGNLILMYACTRISQQRIALLTWSFIKAGVLFLVAFVLVQYALLPTIFLQAMWVFQLITALIGGFSRYLLNKLAK